MEVRAEQIEIVATILGIVGSVVTAVAYLVWWLSKQFAKFTNLVSERFEALRTLFLTKLEYHEKHDDDRFHMVDQHLSAIREDMWLIRLRNAERDKKERDEHPLHQ